MKLHLFPLPPALKTSKKRKAFTLAEVLIAASIFTIVSLIGINVFVNVIRIQRRVTLENAIYEDARVMMERISREIRSNTVDYEEYYNKAMDQEAGFGSITGLGTKNPYGNRYGCYSKRFYNPGTDGPENKNFGAMCANGSTLSAEPDCIIDKTTLDINTGQNPFAGFSTVSPDKDPESANAFCDYSYSTDITCGMAADTDHNVQDELYLVNSQGTQKTIFSSKEITPAVAGPPAVPAEHALALLRLTGQNPDADSVFEQWRDCDITVAPGNTFCCSPGFDCSTIAPTSSLEDTLNYNATTLYQGFVPISPTRTNVVSLKFIVAPLEDPRKAFSETDPALGVQQQPHVTVILTVQPSAAAGAGFSEDLPQITVQTTVTSRIYNEVKSYYTLQAVGSGVCETYLY